MEQKGSIALVIDDSKFACKMFTDMLYSEGFDKIEARGFDSKIEKSISSLNPDLIILGQRPEHGYLTELIEKIREIRIHANVVVSSPICTKGNIAKVMEGGASYFLKKPFKQDDIHSIVLKLFSGVERADRKKTKRQKIINLSISPDELEAYLSCSAKKIEGCKEIGVDLEWIRSFLDENKVVSGIDMEGINQCVRHIDEGESFANILVARGKNAANGENGYVDWKIETDVESGSDSSDTGKFDFRERGFITSVHKGKDLVVRFPSTKGDLGRTVRGRLIMPRKGKEARIIAGKNVEIFEQPDGTKIYRAANDGNLKILGDRVEVEDITVISGDVDYSTGNIKGVGSFKVSGKVQPGFRIEVSGSVEVDDVVEAAEIISKEDIVLKKGIKGHHKGYISCRGSVFAVYLEKSSLEVEGDIIVKNGIYDCNIICGGSVEVTASNGVIVSGSIKAVDGVEAHVIGSESDVKTFVAAGIDYQSELTVERLKREKSLYEDNIKELERSYSRESFENEDSSGFLSKKKGGFKKALLSWKRAVQRIVEIRELIDKYSQEAKDEATSGRVKVNKYIMPGTTVRVGRYTHSIKKRMQRVMFYEDVKEKRILHSYL